MRISLDETSKILMIHYYDPKYFKGEFGGTYRVMWRNEAIDSIASLSIRLVKEYHVEAWDENTVRKLSRRAQDLCGKLNTGEISEKQLPNSLFD